MTNDQHNKYIAFTFLGYAAFQTLMLLFMVAMFSMVFFIPVEPGKPEPPRELFGVMIAFMSVIQFIFTAPAVVAAYGLLKRKSWARIASIVGAVVSAMSVPFGTAACVYALWFFLGDNWKTVYPEQAVGNDSSPRRIEYGVESQRAAYQEEWENRGANGPPDWR